jgi:hypothetical protein
MNTFTLLHKIFQNRVSEILGFLIFIAILFLSFFFNTRKIFQVGWRKSLEIFLITIFVLFPFLNFFTSITAEKITINVHPFSKEYWEFKTQIENYELNQLFFSRSFPLPLPLRIINAIENSIFWPANRLKEIILTFH